MTDWRQVKPVGDLLKTGIWNGAKFELRKENDGVFRWRLDGIQTFLDANSVQRAVEMFKATYPGSEVE
jgi:hypothetical protein